MLGGDCVRDYQGAQWNQGTMVHDVIPRAKSRDSQLGVLESLIVFISTSKLLNYI